MEPIIIEAVDNGKQAFVIKNDQERLAEMVIKVAGNIMTVYHTEVAPKAEGQGLAKNLFNEMVNYARQHQLKVVPLCVFVQAQFNRHPELYSDIL